MGRLNDKVIIVTGAGAGFGRGIVKKLVAENAHVLAVDMNSHTVDETARSVPEKMCVAHAADVTSEQSWKDILEAAVSNFERVDVVVNCAGVVHNAAPSHTVAEEQFDLMFRVNVKPLYLSTKVVVPYWKEKGIEGLFINMSSISEPRPRPNLVWYAASKGAVTVVCV
jgi:3-oxoacyl-[acyl-carrier protein] reductase